jgi:hypothetical protein
MFSGTTRTFDVATSSRLDRLTRDWWRYGWEAKDISASRFSWRKGRRTLEILPEVRAGSPAMNQPGGVFPPIEIRVDGRRHAHARTADEAVALARKVVVDS